MCLLKNVYWKLCYVVLGAFSFLVVAARASGDGYCVRCTTINYVGVIEAILGCRGRGGAECGAGVRVRVRVGNDGVSGNGGGISASRSWRWSVKLHTKTKAISDGFKLPHSEPV